MKPLIMLTVPRTGTGFFKKLLSQHFKPISMGDARCGVSGLVVSHVSMDGVEMLVDIPSALIITTWRDWEKVKKSFLNHGDSLELFEMHLSAWEELVSRFDPMILTVEDTCGSFSKEDRLAFLGYTLGINLETDWAPVNHGSV